MRRWSLPFRHAGAVRLCALLLFFVMMECAAELTPPAPVRLSLPNATPGWITPESPPPCPATAR